MQKYCITEPLKVSLQQNEKYIQTEKPLNSVYMTILAEPPIAPSAHFTVWFLGCHRVCVKADLWS